MSYYTNFRLTTSGKPVEDIDDVMSDNTEYDWRYQSLYDVKWYDSDKHMRKISKLFPETLFTLHGVGEESDDRWQAYYKDGKCQREEAKLTFGPFDESKLK